MKMTFEQWKKEVDRLFLKKTCCDWADLCGDEEPLTDSFSENETPAEFVERVCEKYGLGIDEFGF